MKKFLLMITIFLCMTSTVFAYDFLGNPVPATSGIDDNFYGVETMKNILDSINVTYDDNSIVGFTYYANESLKKLQEKDSSIKIINIVFGLKNDGSLFMIPSNGTFSDTLRYLWLPAQNASYKYLMYLDYEDDDPHVGIAYPFTSSVGTWLYYFNNNGSWESSDWNVTVQTDFTYTEDTLTTKKFVGPISTFVVASQSNDYGARYYFLNNTFEFTKIEEPPAGSGDGEEGGTSPDLSDISQGITNINNNLEELNQKTDELKEKIPSSGDVQNAVTQGTVVGNNEFWGNSGDLTGEQQEELIENKVDELIENISGDMAENEIFGILQNYENKLFGSFTGEEDFKISWQNISYMNKILIPSGEVNFSQMCRDNEALGRVKSTINIILGFFVLMNCVIYLYNLFLATLGIDNPYLYEGRVGSVTVNEFTDENGRTTVTRTQHDGRGNSISRKYNHTMEPKKRQIGFRK